MLSSSLSSEKLSVIFKVQDGGHSHSTYARRRGGGGREKGYVCVRGGRGVLLGQVRTHAKKKVFERPQISDITQKHDKNNTFHNEYFLL